MSERELMNRSEKLFVADFEMRLSVSRRAMSVSLSTSSQISATNSLGRSLKDMAEAEDGDECTRRELVGGLGRKLR